MTKLQLLVVVLAISASAYVGASRLKAHNKHWIAPMGYILIFSCVAVMSLEPKPKDAEEENVFPIPNVAPAPSTEAPKEKFLFQDPHGILKSGFPDSDLVNPEERDVLNYATKGFEKFIVFFDQETKVGTIRTPCIIVVHGKEIFATANKENAARPGARLEEWHARRGTIQKALGLAKT